MAGAFAAATAVTLEQVLGHLAASSNAG